MQQTVYICDGCGKHKQDANHWLRLDVRSGTIIELAKWEHGLLWQEELHYCGAECALKKISEFLSK